MRTLLIRFVALLLIPLIIANPTTTIGSFQNQAFASGTTITGSSFIHSFEEEAFMLQLRYVHRLIQSRHSTFAATPFPHYQSSTVYSFAGVGLLAFLNPSTLTSPDLVPLVLLAGTLGLVAGLAIVYWNVLRSAAYKTTKRTSRAKMTRHLRSHLRRVKSLLDEGLWDEVMQDIQREDGILKPIGGQSDAKGRLLALTNGVAEASRQAAGHSFDLVVYPASGSDLLTAAAFSNHIITISDAMSNLFAPWDKNQTRFRERIKWNLESRLLLSVHAGFQNRDITNYALELILLGADPESVIVTQATRLIKRFGIYTEDQHAFNTTVKFRVGTQSFQHTHVQWHLPIRGERIDKTKEILFENQLLQMLKGHDRVAVLNKGGSPGLALNPDATTSALTLFPLLPEGAIVIADSWVLLKRAIEPHASALQWIDMRTSEIRTFLDKLEGGPEAEGLALGFGYAKHLRDIEIFRLKYLRPETWRGIPQNKSHWFWFLRARQNAERQPSRNDERLLAAV